MSKNLSRNVKNLGTPEDMFLSSSNQGASYVRGCTNQHKNHNINRNGMRGGAQLGSSFDTSVPMGTKGALVGHKSYSGCGTKDPLNLGASSQIGGNYGAIEVGNARYGFNNTDALKNVPAGSFSYPPISADNETSCMKGGKKKGRKSRKKRKHNKKSRSNKKYSSKRNHNKKKHSKKSRSRKKHSKKNKRRKRRSRKSLKGGAGYHQFNSNVPHTNTYGITNQGILPSGKLASPIPIKVSNNCHDVYNHYTKTNYEAPARS